MNCQNLSNGKEKHQVGKIPMMCAMVSSSNPYIITGLNSDVGVRGWNQGTWLNHKPLPLPEALNAKEDERGCNTGTE